MTTSRRTFLRLLGLASVGLVVDPKLAVIANNEVYVNSELGIAFKIPSAWHFYNVQYVRRMHNKQVLKLDASSLREILKELNERPLVTFGMHPEDDHDTNSSTAIQFSPSIVLRVEQHGGVTLDEIPYYSDRFLKNAVKDYSSIGSHQFLEISGYRSVIRKYRYLYEAAGMNPTPIIGRSCIIDAETHFYSFNMYNYDPEDSYVEECFTQLESSVAIL